MKRLIALLMATAMVVGLAACGAKTEAPAATEAATTAAATTAAAAQAATTAAAAAAPAAEESHVWNLDGTMFPLAEPVTFKVMTSGYRYADLENIVNCEDWKALCKETNVNFEFDFLGEYDAPESGTNLQMRLQSGDYGDVIWSVYLDNLTKADINDMAAAGMAVAIDDYMKDPAIMPNVNKAVIVNNPYLTQAMKSDDGKIYGFYGLSSLAKYTSDEGLLQVNEAWMKAWQAAKGVDHSPATIAEFEDMLAYFHDNDMNGDGNATDEVPYFIAQATYNGTSSLEASMGMYGIGIKDSAVDMDIMINDAGECYYVYTTPEFKEACKTFGGWYQKGYIWEEIFTGNADTIAGVVADAANKIGVINTCYDTDGFIPVMPPVAEGYTAKYHTHPSVRNGIEGQAEAVITDKCQHPEILAAFFDIFYQFENNLTVRYGSKIWSDGEVTVNADGKYVLNVPGEPVKGTPDAERAVYDYLAATLAYTPENLEKVDLDSWLGSRACIVGGKMYDEAGIWNKTENLWPRCTLLSDKQDDYAFMYTDVSAVVAEYRAKFITGQLDIDAKWDEFQKKIEDLGVKDMQKIVQDSYDAYVGK